MVIADQSSDIAVEARRGRAAGRGVDDGAAIVSCEHADIGPAALAVEDADRAIGDIVVEQTDVRADDRADMACITRGNARVGQSETHDGARRFREQAHLLVIFLVPDLQIGNLIAEPVEDAGNGFVTTAFFSTPSGVAS